MNYYQMSDDELALEVINNHLGLPDDFVVSKRGKHFFMNHKDGHSIRSFCMYGGKDILPLLIDANLDLSWGATGQSGCFDHSSQDEWGNQIVVYEPFNAIDEIWRSAVIAYLRVKL